MPLHDPERSLNRERLVIARPVVAAGKRLGGILRLPIGQHSIGVGFIVIVRIRELANPILAMPVGNPHRPGAGAAAVPELYAAGDADQYGLPRTVRRNRLLRVSSRVSLTRCAIDNVPAFVPKMCVEANELQNTDMDRVAMLQ